jgi:hypothetical protein
LNIQILKFKHILLVHLQQFFNYLSDIFQY